MLAREVGSSDERAINFGERLQNLGTVRGHFVEPLLDVDVDVRLVSSPTDDACVPATSRPRAVLDTCVKVQKGTAPFSRHGRARVSQNVLAKQEGRLSFSRCLVRLGAGKLLDVVGACLSTLFADIKSAT